MLRRMTLHHIGEILRVDRLLRRIMPQIGHHEQCPCLPVGFRFYRQEMGGGNGAGNGGRALGSVNGWRSPSATAPGTQQRRQRENDHDGELLGSRRQFLPAQTFWGRRCRTGGALSSSPDAAPPAPPPILPPTAGFRFARPIGADEFREGTQHARPACTKSTPKRAKCPFALQTSRPTATRRTKSTPKRAKYHFALQTSRPTATRRPIGADEFRGEPERLLRRMAQLPPPDRRGGFFDTPAHAPSGIQRM